MAKTLSFLAKEYKLQFNFGKRMAIKLFASYPSIFLILARLTKRRSLQVWVSREGSRVVKQLKCLIL